MMDLAHMEGYILQIVELHSKFFEEILLIQESGRDFRTSFVIRSIPGALPPFRFDITEETSSVEISGS